MTSGNRKIAALNNNAGVVTPVGAIKTVPVPAPAQTFHTDDGGNDSIVAPVMPKIPVRFKGGFGTLRLLYDEVFVDESGECPLLVLIQSSPDGQFFETPLDCENPIGVEFEAVVLSCLGGVRYTMPDGNTCHTVYFIDEGE